MTDAIIIGAGPAGAAAAIGLARAGAKTLLLERMRETGDALCGGFLSWHSLARLDALGIDRAALGGQQLTQVRLFAGRRSSETNLPQTAMGVSRRRLDTLLQAAAVAAGADMQRGVYATMIDGATVQTRDGATLAAPALFLAAGKHGFRGQPRAPAPWQQRDPVMGLRLRLPHHIALDRLIGDAVELHLFDRGYAGLVRQEDGSANLCLATHKSRLDEAGGDPEALLRALGAAHPVLGERLAYADWSQSIDAIGHVPYGWRTADAMPGLFRLGDQAGVIPSLAGEGMGLALASGNAAVAAWRRGGGDAAPAFQRALAARMTRPFGIASAVWRTGENPRTAGGLTSLAAAFPSLVRWASQATRIRDD
ncbi:MULTISPECIES: FAD-dependent monooxygenase [unclassified Sphingopyxis]|jgi:menaquinone-9 beta-reductase|uniref:NAD(P)/FAD-dependent oxidoreductase n=1 Tax=unclassified Sphingopyxis TaxID=2614943 RepID=UPI0028543C70|nr:MULTISPECIES: FAD-dependent monooxygenase [unclassified Sphingopyxis]MDR6833255.1 flavin-dependent dehydrogenase [Sphingopyxis sp. BE122]MDR7225524.1 flavin-dependent dehydrogenase [Sphingopyxis sp. BE259]